ncbi:hypothetical protein HGK49_06330 [Helicobacter pylori]|uniref:hypothetical protein n=2 Tax=Helicobacter pylori TaxID=210 RepID=UPI001920F125|nr:hypothetical protein [Helicobacter pylori]QQW66597.1 hypothetical protein HGK49_06330 [Helicobacter pylori]
MSKIRLNPSNSIFIVVGFLKIIKPIRDPNKNARNTAQLKGGIEASFEFILIFKKWGFSCLIFAVWRLSLN